MRPHLIGQTHVQRVLEFEGFPAPANLIFPNCTPDVVARGREWLDGRFIARDADALLMSFQSFVVRSRGLVILVDACNGNDKERPGMEYCHKKQFPYLANLAAAGLKPEDIDIVLCTHLHFDHVGWNTRLENGRWVPTFPNAKYLMSKADYDWFASGQVEPPLNIAFNDSVLPIMEHGQAQLIDNTHLISHEIGDGIWLEDAAGHTPGSVVMHCQDKGGGSAVFSGDVLHHPVQLEQLDLHIHGEWDDKKGLAVRRRLIESCADSDTTVFTAHFPTPTSARFHSHKGGFRARFD
jgi:glyoxylase-like metal-dependent hydrolase (beta-lactamase superfamily II)